MCFVLHYGCSHLLTCPNTSHAVARAHNHLHQMRLHVVLPHVTATRGVTMYRDATMFYVRTRGATMYAGSSQIPGLRRTT